MDAVGEAVLHITFGEGTVESADGRYLTVRFRDGARRFVYPSAFRSYLTAKSEAWASEIRRDLLALDAEEAKKAAHRESEASRLRGGIVIPGRHLESHEEQNEP